MNIRIDDYIKDYKDVVYSFNYECIDRDRNISFEKKFDEGLEMGNIVIEDGKIVWNRELNERCLKNCREYVGNLMFDNLDEICLGFGKNYFINRLVNEYEWLFVIKKSIEEDELYMDDESFGEIVKEKIEGMLSIINRFGKEECMV